MIHQDINSPLSPPFTNQRIVIFVHNEDPLLNYTNYIDSMLILAEYNTFSTYDFMLRTDLDGFLAPGIYMHI
jgi:hypothetical protein